MHLGHGHAIGRHFMTLFSELDIMPALAEAIATRGYETATPVQVAVADPANQGKDLLVSSQTGSGKTLAFGSLIARALLAPPVDPNNESAPAPAPNKKGRAPSALVVAPTRELANQVRTELGWLFAKTGLHVVAFTGGSDVFRDLKNLQSGVDIAVGTPGRLVDLLSRQSLRLDQVKAVVLDEADEMLDMGFQEDMATLLGAAVNRVATHMFSATLPRPILSMAAKYQKDARRIDARSLGESSSHEDIRHMAHLIAIGDRFPAVINVLRQNAEGRTIVFGTTRDGVADLHQELVRQGFKAVVLSGDRAQAERNRALTALREGDAQILVATNVAARGLDLPEVDLVVHADLPLNVEALTHRSGRTGRAGRKGTSVLLANIAERRKAERLMDFAKIEVKWSHAPSAEDIANRNEALLEARLRDAASSEEAPSSAAVGMLERLGEDVSQERLLLHLLDLELSRVPKGESIRYVDFDAIKSGRGREVMGPPPSRNDFSRDAVRFKLNLGKESKAEPGWLLPLICRRGGVTRRDVGAIRVFDRYSEFEISADAANDFSLAASQPDPRAPQVFIERSGGGVAERPRPAKPIMVAAPKAKSKEISVPAPKAKSKEIPLPAPEAKAEPAIERDMPMPDMDRPEVATKRTDRKPLPITFGKLRREGDEARPANKLPAPTEGGFAVPKRKIRETGFDTPRRKPTESEDKSFGKPFAKSYGKPFAKPFGKTRPFASSSRGHDGSVPAPHAPPPWKAKGDKPGFGKPTFGKPTFGKPAFGKSLEKNKFGKDKARKPFAKKPA